MVELDMGIITGYYQESQSKKGNGVIRVLGLGFGGWVFRLGRSGVEGFRV